MSRGPLRTALAVAAVALVSTLAACESGQQGPALPGPEAMEGLYGTDAEVRLNGNVVDVRVEQSPRQLKRGGPLWARVGPYIFLFSPQTREVFEQYPGVAAVRVQTFTPAGERVAEATLRHDELNAITWKEARSRVTRARREGTDKPGYLEDLVQYGEEHTAHDYNPSYTGG